MTEEAIRTIRANIAKGLALADSSDWQIPSPTSGDDVEDGFGVGVPLAELDLTRFARGLRDGFTSAEEEAARQSPRVQNLARIYWRVEPVSFWMLTRYAVEGDQFPFAVGLRLHLQELWGRAAQRKLHSTYLEILRTGLSRYERASEEWNRLRDKILTWEAGLYCYFTEMPALRVASADRTQEAFDHREVFEDGLELNLAEVRYSSLEVSASLPREQGSPRSLRVIIVGETGEQLSAEVELKGSGKFVTGHARIGDLDAAQRRLGRQCLVVVTREPPPTSAE